MKLELGKFEINDVQFAEKSYIENHVLYVNKAEVEALVLEDDKLIDEIERLKNDPETLARMASASRACGPDRATEIICDTILEELQID